MRARMRVSAAGMTARDVIERLEEAGAVLLAIGGTRPGPRRAHAQSEQWPVVHEVIEAYGWTGARVRPAIPDAHAISRMDEALGWLGLIPPDRYVLRRIVGGRALVSPLTGRHLFTWTQMARLLGAEPRAVKAWHRAGIAAIVGALGTRAAA